MKPESNSKKLLAITRSKAKMYEFDVPEKEHIAMPKNPSFLFDLTIGILEKIAYSYSSGELFETIEKKSNFKDDLLFSSQFFEAYLNSKLNTELDNHMILLSSAAFYLCDLPGSSSVLIKKIEPGFDLGCSGLDLKLYNRLKYNIGLPKDQLLDLRSQIYKTGSDVELIFIDVLIAVTIQKIENSSRNCLSKYTTIPIELWEHIINKPTFIKEFWPSQRKIGEFGVYDGKSAIIQMPTSAGKTKAIEIIIRSAFISGRTSLAVIVAPFRALCHEIHLSLKHQFEGEEIRIDEIFNTFQMDISIEKITSCSNCILVLTPEKLNYILRHDSELSQHIGLIIYDEGHLFDDSSRGVNYELLLSSLKMQMQDDKQVILISAVVKNSEDLNHWLLNDSGAVISGINLTPTPRSIVFSSWRRESGDLIFYNSNEFKEKQFFVPNIIKTEKILNLNSNKRAIDFPKKKDISKISIYLALKLAKNGSVAIFSGTKRSAFSQLKKILDAYKHELLIPKPIEYSDQLEGKRILHLCIQNFGVDSEISKAAKIGVYLHYGNTSQGMKMAIEYALQENKVKFVLCTSTLAQGVNFPLRYLIVSGTRQGYEEIKVRDFHNLMGRAGRAGLHTEGSIIFSNTEIYDLKEKNDYHWRKTLKLLNPNNTEPCNSNLIRLFDPYKLPENNIYPFDLKEFIELYFYYEENLVEKIVSKISYRENDSVDLKREIKKLENQIENKVVIFRSLESFLLANMDYFSDNLNNESVEKFVHETLAYSQASINEKTLLLNLFNQISGHLSIIEENKQKRQCYGKTFLGVRECQNIESWILNEKQLILNSNTFEKLSNTLSRIIIEKSIPQKVLNKNNFNSFKSLYYAWLEGCPYHIIHQEVKKVNFGTLKKQRSPKIDDVIDICENNLSYKGSLLIGAILDIIALYPEFTPDNIHLLKIFQKCLKYGLPSEKHVLVHEIGFVDRVICQEIVDSLSNVPMTKEEIISYISKNKEIFGEIIDKYPSYYYKVLDSFF